MEGEVSVKTKEYDYFGYFTLAGESAVQAAMLLKKTVANFRAEEFPKQMKAMHELEHLADERKHEMMEHLAHEFITPIERNDLAALAGQFDDVIDCIDNVTRCMYMYNIQRVRPEAVEFSERIEKIMTALYHAAEEFPNYKKSGRLGEMLVEINRLESSGDDLHCESMRKLYEKENDTREVMIWTRLYEDLEACLDACEDCADIMESIAMNNL